MSFSCCSEIWGKYRTNTTGPTCQNFQKFWETSTTTGTTVVAIEANNDITVSKNE